MESEIQWDSKSDSEKYDPLEQSQRAEFEPVTAHLAKLKLWFWFMT